MKIEIEKWGRGAGIRLPDEFLRELGWKQEDMVQLTVREGKCFVKAVRIAPAKSSERRGD